MGRKCSTCQHIKRAEIDRRLSAGEPVSAIAADYKVAPSSLQRHRANCVQLAPSNAIMKEAARGSAALASLPSKEELGGSYFGLCGRIDTIIAQAEQQGSLKVAVSGLNSLRQTLDSLSRLSGHDRQGAQVNVAVQTNINVDLTNLKNRLIDAFEAEPEVRERLAKTLLEMSDE
jgi:hypothetical protein